MSTVLNENTEPQPALPSAEPSQPAAPAVPSTAPEAEPAIDPKDRRAFIANELKKSTERGKHAQFQPRENGKFAGAPQFPKPEAAPQAPAAPVAAPTPVRPEMPKNLKAELKAHWDAAHPDLLTAFVQRDADYNKGIAEVFKPAKAQLEELLNEFKPYESLLRAEGATPKTAIAPLLQTAAILRTGSPAHKAAAVAHMMRQFGIPIEHIQQVLTSPSNGITQPQAALDPYSVQQLIDQRLGHFQREQALATASTLIEEFGNNPEHNHFGEVRSTMAALLQSDAFLSQTQAMTEREQLKAAYDAACFAHPVIRQQILAEQQAKELAERQAAQQAQVTQARQAAVQVKGAPSVGPAPKPDPKDRRAVIANAIRGSR